mgnify:CR=1 FL=1
MDGRIKPQNGNYAPKRRCALLRLRSAAQRARARLPRERARARDGAVPIDFGVKGGELDKDTRAPSNLMDSWSPPVRAAAGAFGFHGR